MASTTISDRTATRQEVLGARKRLGELAAVERLSAVRVDIAGTVIVHSEAAGYGPVRRFATSASNEVGAWVNVITDDVPAAEVASEAL